MGLFKLAFDKVRAGLTKTSDTLGTALGVGKLDEARLKQLRIRMIQADIGVRTSDELIKDLQAGWERGEIETTDQARKFVVDQLVAYWPEEDRSLHFAEQGPTVILVAGVNGAGKTTSIAKITKALRDENRSVILGACDTFRAAAVEQLRVWSQRLEVEFVPGQPGGDPAAVAFDAAEKAVARNFDVLILDTAGRLHTQEHLMRQLVKIRNVVQRHIPQAPHEVILVLDATTGQNAINQARVFTEAIDVTGIFLAKLDGTARGGIVVAIREQLGIPVKFVGVGERPQDVEPFDPPRFVEAMFTS